MYRLKKSARYYDDDDRNASFVASILDQEFVMGVNFCFLVSHFDRCVNIVYLFLSDRSGRHSWVDSHDMSELLISLHSVKQF